MGVAEIGMLKWINGNTRKYRIRNEEICFKIRVAPFGEKMRESRLRWFGHLQRKIINAPMRKSELLEVEETKKGRGIPKVTLV